MAGILERIRRAGRAPMYTLSVQAARSFYEAGAEILEPSRAPLVRVENLLVPGAGSAPLAARLYAASQHPKASVLFLHGGGFVVGSLETHDSLCRQLALHSGAAVLALDYRRAPEHRFPAAVDDAWAALQWLHHEGADRLKICTRRLAVAGDSAGGTLAAVCALKARDSALPLAFQLLITPGTGASADTDSHRRFAEGFVLDAATIAWFYDHYLGVAARGDWRFAPLNAESVEGVAPAFVVLAENDPLVDEGLAYADRLRAAGVTVQLELVRGVTHEFIKMGRLLPQAGETIAAAARALREALHLDLDQNS